MSAASIRGTLASRWFPAWRREALRTTLWVVPSLLVLLVCLLFGLTYGIDRAAYRGDLSLPAWVDQGSPDAARALLIAVATAVITVVGVVFSVTIVALTLASQQFGPRMLRNFIRDLGTQVSLGAFVATFVYAMVALATITSRGSHGPFVPHLSVTVALALLLINLAVLIYFIHHITVTIQLPEVIAGISRDLGRAIEVQFAEVADPRVAETGPSLESVRGHLESATIVTTQQSGYLQFVRYQELVDIAAATGSVIQLLYRPGHFITTGLPLAKVWPAETTPSVAKALHRAHVPGAHRTLTQDPVFAIDQLVEIAIRALSPAVNDTFTALTCIDWLADALCKISQSPLGDGVHRDRAGVIRVIELGADYERIVNRATDKIRQASRDMAAVAIRQLDGLIKVLAYTTSDSQRAVLHRQALRIHRASEAEIPDVDDRDLLRMRFGVFESTLACCSSSDPGGG